MGSKMENQPISIKVSGDTIPVGVSHGIVDGLRSMGHNVSTERTVDVVNGEFVQGIRVGVDDIDAKRAFTNLSNTYLEKGYAGLEEELKSQHSITNDAPEKEKISDGVVWRSVPVKPAKNPDSVRKEVGLAPKGMGAKGRPRNIGGGRPSVV